VALPWDLEDWLTNAGDLAARKKVAEGLEALDGRERLVYEVWLFDTEIRNGGVSQYFGNRGVEQWERLRAACRTFPMATLKQFIEEVDQALGYAHDRYKAALSASPPLEKRYWDVYQVGVVEELRQLVLNRI
jgi:hypothetical protein